MNETEAIRGEKPETAPSASANLESHAAARVLNALGDPTRRRMVEMLSRAPRTVSSLAAALEVTLTAVGQHLAILESCGLARTEKLGRTRTCSLERTGLNTLQHWIQELRTPLEQSLDHLGDLLAEENNGSGDQNQQP